jgi:D-alanyl-D-alanine endopeptidase (penicillin-binding protein 7)
MKKRLALILMLSVLSTPAFAKHKHKHKSRPTSPFGSPVVLISDVSGITHYEKNSSKVVPIASISKLMAALVVLESGVPLDTPITITEEDVVSSSKLKVGTTLSRGEMINAALMSSDNRAAHCITRTLNGNLQHAVALMNEKARQLGMSSTVYVEPTGLDVRNKSTAADLSKLLVYTTHNAKITEYSTMASNQIGNKQFYNTNAYIRSGAWDNVLVSKTGFTNAAGKCIALSMMFGDKVYDVVILGARNKKQRLNDLAMAKKMILTKT